MSHSDRIKKQHENPEETVYPRSAALSQRVKCFLQKNKWLIAAFFLPILLTLIAFAFSHIFPFGEKSVLVLDLAGQYAWYLEALRDAFSGGSLIYSFHRSLGGEFLGIFAYYLASPLNFLVLLFSENSIDIAILLILLLKVAAAGATMFFYLSKKEASLAPWLLLSFSSAFALCGFSVAYQHNIMWMDAFLLLPLFVYGLELLADTGKAKFYTVVFALIFLTNYYIGYMSALFAVGYFVTLMVLKSTEQKQKNKQEISKKTTTFILSSVFAVFLSSLVWVPGIYSLTLGKLGAATKTRPFSVTFSIPEALFKFFPASYDSLMESGLPFLYIGIPLLFLLPLFFSSEKISKKEKWARGAGLALLFFSMWFRAADMLFHGFRAPNCLNYRYAFFLVFLLITTAAKGAAHPPRKYQKPIIATAVSVGIFSVFAFFFSKSFFPIALLVISFISILFSAILLLHEYMPKKKIKSQVFSAIFSVLLLLELTANAALTYLAMDKEVGFTDRADFQSGMAELDAMISTVKEADGGFYRTETKFHHASNDAMGAKMFGISGSTSTQHTASLTLLKNLGYPSASHWSTYSSPNPFADALLGIKYISSDRVPDGYTAISAENTNIYKNDAALSFAYAVNSTDLTFGVNAAENCNALAKQLVGKDHGDLFSPIGDEKRLHIGGTLYDAEENSYVLLKDKNADATAMVFTVTASTSGDVWFLLPSAAATKMIVSCRDFTETAFSRAKGHFIYLGKYEVGETVRVQLTFDSEATALTFYKDEPHFYTFSNETNELYLSELAKTQISFDCVENSRMTGSFVAEGSTEMLLTLPYDPCLAVFVDGTRVETYSALGLTGFETDAGAHNIEVRYIPTALYIGIGISLADIAAFCIYYLWKKKNKKSEDSDVLLDKRHA